MMAFDKVRSSARERVAGRTIAIDKGPAQLSVEPCSYRPISSVLVRANVRCFRVSRGTHLRSEVVLGALFLWMVAALGRRRSRSTVGILPRG
jgi:hypothetical protein